MGLLIGKAIVRMRGDMEWSQQFLADRSGISRSWVAALETGRIESPGVDALEKLARAFGMRPTQFLKSVIEPYDTDMSRDERRLLMVYRALSDTQRRTLMDVARGLSLLIESSN